MLQDIAAKLTEVVQPNGMCARWGGDEFVFVVSSDSSSSVAATEAAITTQLKEGLPFVSFGTAVFGTDSTNFDGCLVVADERMYQSKSERKRADHKVRSQPRRRCQVRRSALVAGQKPLL